jgi:hypothetical protein
LVELAELSDALVQVRNQVDDQIKMIEALLHGSQRPLIQSPPASPPGPCGETRYHPGPC